MPVAFVRADILYAWKGPSLLIVNTRGECGPDQQLSGYYFREARFLSTLRLEINREPLWVCEAASVDPTSLAFTYGHPEIKQPGGGGTGQSGDEESTDAHGLPERSIDLRVGMQVGIGDLTITITVANRARRPLRFELACALDADFADIQEAQAGRREQHAPVTACGGDEAIEFSYAHPRLPFRTRVVHDSRWRCRDRRLVADLTIDARHAADLALRVVPTTGEREPGEEEVRDREAAFDEWRGRFARVDMPQSGVLEESLRSNIRDVASLVMLEGPRDEWLAVQAGMPLYPAFFGRDALTAGWQASFVDRGELLAATLTKLGRLQTSRFDDWRDEQPGRVPYQVRSGPLARLDINPYSAYYADFASPLMFVISLANLWAWTGDRRDLETHWDAARRILDWAREYGDLDGDGYLEYQTRSSKGTKNQGWKDSGDAIIYDDGTPVPAPIATCEIQGYWYAAQELMAVLAFAMNARADARAYRDSAATLKARFNRDWWMSDERFFALALDADKRQVRAITSNVGHCIASGIIDAEHLPAVVGRMFAPDLFSGWGIRTLSTGHAFYNPLSYHRGTIWAVEQATTLFGLRRFGFDARTIDLARALFDLSRLYPEYRIPECIGGYARGQRPVPGAYPRANTPQLWNATAFPLAIQSLLGLLPLAAANTLVVDPLLPEWIPELILRDLRVGGARVTLRFLRDQHGASAWEVLRKEGTLHIVRQPAPESLSTKWTDRAVTALETLLK